MDQKFTFLIARDISCPINCLGLSVVNGRRPIIPCALDGPAVFVRYHVLVLAHCYHFLSNRLMNMS